ncbi:type VII secretion protein EccE [Mycolicibacterium moriokaense]|uniref:Type VII secretion protein EccE n=1 Tax=Mycolicibacterium moriokaense TaxID=39691 RepID=A0A318H9V7_9MYCO|nr:type VII secretion protein EccE [Mycolicibacterium moriokaense]PXX03218.1 type VII secretion protein EccE [Mycolicibacterium moriokaense]
MKERALGLRAALPVVIATEVVAIGAYIGLAPVRFGWWPAAVITAVAFLLMVVTVYRRNLPGWIAALRRWRSQRRRPVGAAASTDVTQGNIVCGVRVDEYEAVTMLNVAGRAYSPTFLRGSTVSLTTNVLPLDVLIGLLDQPGGLKLAGIDIVSSGQRVRRGAGYPPLYSTLLADRPAAGRRDTRLIVRLDLTDSVGGLSYRASIGAAAAAATERIVNALLQEGIRATVLTAAELDAATEELSAGLAEAPEQPAPEGEVDADLDARAPVLAGARAGSASAGRGGVELARRAAAEVGWRTVNARPGHLTTYYFSPEDITTAALHQMWALRTDHVVQVTSLAKQRRVQPDGGGPVMVSAMVRINDPQRPQQPPTLDLNTLPGDQYDAALRAAPTARPRLRLPKRELGDPDELVIPIGPTGILVGAALRDDPHARIPIQRDDMIMWSLTDPQRATRVVMDTSDFYVRQLLLRAAAVGERIAIFSNQPQRWVALSQPNIAVVERRRGPEFVPTIIVNDRPVTHPSVGLSATVVTLGHADRGPAPDIRFVQTSRSTVRITSGAYDFDVAIVAFRQEQAWTG